MLAQALLRVDNRRMFQSVHLPLHPAAARSHLVSDFFVDECPSNASRVVPPSASAHLVVRFGPHVTGGFDIHVLGPRDKVRRKSIRGRQSTVLARLPWGTYRAVLGTTATELAGRIVALSDLWDSASTQRLQEQLAAARDTGAAVIALKTAIAERLDRDMSFDANARLVQRAARSLEHRNVTSVAAELGVSERHLRRVFRELVGLNPKTFYKLMRFERALEAAKVARGSSWSEIAVDAGYYDQAHLIADFRSIAAATPREFLAEVRKSSVSSKRQPPFSGGCRP